MKPSNRLFAVTLLAVFFLTACQTANPGDVLFQDDFSQTTGGWKVGASDHGLAEYNEGALRVLVSASDAVSLSVPQISFGDARIEVDAWKADGADDNQFGIVCRYRDLNNFYFLVISSDGYFGVGKFKDNQFTLLGMAEYQPSEVIQQSAAVNHLRADCIGDTLTLYVNGQKLIEVQDKDFASGSVGVLAGAFQTPGVDVRFDNFTVTQP